jgi:hypothetical protein
MLATSNLKDCAPSKHVREVREMDTKKNTVDVERRPTNQGYTPTREKRFVKTQLLSHRKVSLRHIIPG